MDQLYFGDNLDIHGRRHDLFAPSIVRKPCGARDVVYANHLSSTLEHDLNA